MNPNERQHGLTLATLTLAQLRERRRLNRDRGIASSRELLAEIAAREAAEAAGGVAAAAREHVQTIPTEVIAAAARGEIDLNDYARRELASRGLNHDGKWIGFAAAERLAHTRTMWGQRGERITVSIPEESK